MDNNSTLEYKDKYIKIVYFDLDSALDMVNIFNEGQKTTTTTKTENNTKKGSFFAHLKIPVSIFGVGGNSEILKNIEEIKQGYTTSLPITDFLHFFEKHKNEVKINEFNNIEVYFYENSITYVKTVSPFLNMIDGKFATNDLDINISKIDQALKEGKGYYECLFKNNGIESILRFNLNAFKNGYAITDLKLMRLSYIAVKVGKIYKNQLDLDNFIKPVDKKDFSQSLLEDSCDNNGFNDAKQELDVYDVLLAGVKNV